MRVSWVLTATLAVVGWAALCGCGKKQELIPGAESMTDEQKMQQVEQYCAQWAADLKKSVDARRLPGIACDYRGVQPDPKGCAIELGRFDRMMEAELAPMLIYSPVDIGQLKATMVYKLGPGGNQANAECVFSLTAAAGPNDLLFGKEYRPDPRVFAVFLPKEEPAPEPIE